MCKYCEENFEDCITPLDKNAHVCIYNKYNELNVNWYGHKMKININYCPMCGRRLGE